HELMRAHEALQDFGMGLQRFPLGHFERGPKLVIAAGDLPVGGAGDDVTAEGILPKHEVEGRVELVWIDLPGTESAVGQLGRQQGLTDATDHASLEHGPDALDDRLEGQVGLLGDVLEGMALKSLDEVFGDREDAAVDRIVVFYR